jgi:hypothetical protein
VCPRSRSPHEGRRAPARTQRLATPRPHLRPPHADSSSLNLALTQFNFAQSSSPWGAQAQLAYTAPPTSSFGVVESSKPTTERDLDPTNVNSDKQKHDEKKQETEGRGCCGCGDDEEEEEEEGAHDIVLCCGAEKGGICAPYA